MDHPLTGLKVDVLSLMEKRLPRYVVNCFQAAGFGEIEVIASMDVSESEANSISKIEEYIQRRHKSNPEMLPPCCSPEPINSLPFEFPPGHRIRICKFVHEVKQIYKNKHSSLKPASTKHAGSVTTAKKAKLIEQPVDQVPLSVDEVNCQVHESIDDWIRKQKLMYLSSLKEGKHYSVTVNNRNNGQIAVAVHCTMCRTSIHLHPQSNHFQISNWTRHTKKCASRYNADDPKQPKLFSKQSASSVSTEKFPTKQPAVALAGSSCIFPNNDLASSNLEKGNNQQIFH